MFHCVFISFCLVGLGGRMVVDSSHSGSQRAEAEGLCLFVLPCPDGTEELQPWKRAKGKTKCAKQTNEGNPREQREHREERERRGDKGREWNQRAERT